MKSRKDKILNIKKIKKQVKGITLIALVVTIIVLLILAGVALNITIGQNGVFQRAQGAADTWRNAESNEQLAMQEGSDLIDEYLNGNKDNPSTGVTTVDTVPIPDGFYYAGGSKDTGLVISDNSADKKEFSEETKTQSVPNTLQGNQFVWVPVETPSNYFIDEEATLNTTATGSGEENKVTTNVYSNLTVRSGDSSSYTASTPGDTTSKSVREPDVLSSYDTNEQYLEILGFESTKAMADSFVAEYKAMSDSIKKYKGFYIGRYELTGSVESPTEKAGESLTNQNWYNLYKACQNVVQDETGIVKSTMIYGVQWDAVCSWLKQSGFDTDSNSSIWGNYSNSSGNADIEGAGSKQDTGFSEYWKANNIYDLAGNCREWTQEAYSTNQRVYRRWWRQRFRLWRSSFRPFQQQRSELFEAQQPFFSCHTLYRVVLKAVVAFQMPHTEMSKLVSC